MVYGKSFADVGGLWGTTNEKLSVAHGAGAVEVTMVDITPPETALWDDLRACLHERGVPHYSFISANIDDPETPPQLGRFDVVHCSGLLYHVPNPIHTLTQLGRICRHRLVLTSVVLPERVTSAAGGIELEPGELIFVPYLAERQREILHDYLDQMGVSDSLGVQTPYHHWDVSDYAPWWWMFTRGVLHQLASSAGFDILDEGDAWDGRAYCLLLSPR